MVDEVQRIEEDLAKLKMASKRDQRQGETSWIHYSKSQVEGAVAKKRLARPSKLENVKKFG